MAELESYNCQRQLAICSKQRCDQELTHASEVHREFIVQPFFILLSAHSHILELRELRYLNTAPCFLS